MHWLEIATYAVLGVCATVSIVVAVVMIYWRYNDPR